MKSGANRPVLVAVVEMKNPLMERTSRQIQFAFAKKILQNAGREGAMGLDGFPSQGLFFSNIRYANPVPVFPIPRPQLTSLPSLTEDDLILCVTGIANEKPFVKYLRRFNAKVKVLHYDDHHYFTRSDFDYIFDRFDELEGRRKFIVTTEKDSVRILNNAYYPPTRRDIIYFVPIKVGFLDQGDQDFIEVLEKKITSNE